MNSDETVALKVVTLLYRESEMPEGTDSTDPLVLQVLEKLNTPETGVLNDPTARGSVVTNLASIAYNLLNSRDEHPLDDFLQTVRSGCGMHLDVYECVKDGVKDDITPKQRVQQIRALRRYLKGRRTGTLFGDLVARAYRDYMYLNTELVMGRVYQNQFMGALEELSAVGDEDQAVVTNIDLSDADSVNRIITETKSYHSTIGMLQTGYQGLNKMLQGGFRRGECVVVSALQHNYKTGFGLSLFKDFMLYNKPYMIDKTKKPCVVRISFEDDTSNDIEFLYTALTDGGALSDLGDDAVRKAAKMIGDRLSETGYTAKLLRVNPSDWTYKDIFNCVRTFESEGYEIHALCLDYLGMVPTVGCVTTGPTGTDIRDLFRRVRNFCSARKITLVTPHQMSTDAKMLVRSDVKPVDFVKTVANRGYYAGTRQLDQEVDVELYLHIVQQNDKSYLCVQRGKHRIPTIIPESQKYMILPFPETGPIRADIGDTRSDKRELSQFTSTEEFNF